MKNNLLKHTLLFSAFVLLAQVIGLIRDLYLARVFGVGGTLDVYYMAFKIPDFLNVFYSVFLGSVVFIPLLTAAKNISDDEMLKKVREIGSLVLVLIAVASVFLFAFMPYFADLLAPTWTPERRELLVHLSRILLIAQFFFPVGILAGSIGMIYKRPFYMASSGFIYNLFIFIITLLLVPYFGVYGVVVGVLAGAISFAVVQMIPREVRQVYSKFRFTFSYLEWIIFFKRNFSRFLAVLAYQLFAMLLLYIAGFSGEGGVSVFSIAYNVYMAFFFVLGASLSTAAMPTISEHHVTGNKLAQRTGLNNSIIYMFYVGSVITLLAYVFSTEIIQILYYFSNISLDREIQIGQILALLLLALPFFNLLEIIRKYLYSTNQIPFAGSMTVFLLFSVLVSTFFLSKILVLNVLPSLGLAILISNIFCLLYTLYILQKSEQITFSLIIKNVWKVIVVSGMSYIVYISASPYFANLVSNFFGEIVLNGLILLAIFVFFSVIFQDRIAKIVLDSLYRRGV